MYLSFTLALFRGDHKETYRVVQPYRTSRKSNLWLLEFKILSGFQDNALFLTLTKYIDKKINILLDAIFDHCRFF